MCQAFTVSTSNCLHVFRPQKMNFWDIAKVPMFQDYKPLLGRRSHNEDSTIHFTLNPGPNNPEPIAQHPIIFNPIRDRNTKTSTFIDNHEPAPHCRRTP